MSNDNRSIARALRVVSALIALTALSVIVAHKACAETPNEPKTFEKVEIAYFDDAPKDQSFLVFRNKLMQTVDDRDVKALLGVLDPTIVSGYDGQEGIDAFKAKWKLDEKPDDSPLWKELHEVLRLGGKLNKGESENHFIAPYVYYALPEKYDATEFGIVVGDGVRVRAQPDETSEVIAKVGRIIVRLFTDEKLPNAKIGNETFPWRKVGLPDGTVGYIWGKFVRSPIDYRAGFSNQLGQWKMTYFIVGD